MKVNSQNVKSAIIDALQNNRCNPGEHVFDYERIGGQVVFCCAECRYSVIPNASDSNLPQN